MKKAGIILFIFTFWSSTLLGDTSKQNMDVAKQQIQKAILKLPEVRSAKKRVEKYLIKKVNISKGAITAISSTVLTLQQGEINTKVIKNINFKVLGGQMRPDIIYNFNNNTVRGIASINWVF